MFPAKLSERTENWPNDRLQRESGRRRRCAAAAAQHRAAQQIGGSGSEQRFAGTTRPPGTGRCSSIGVGVPCRDAGRGQIAAVGGDAASAERVPAGTNARAGAQPSAARALRNMRIQGEASGQSPGAQLKLIRRRVRSGCGIRIVTRPSSLVTPAIASVEPLGLAG